MALNRAIALGKVHGPTAGLKALDELKNEKALQRYYLFYAVRAELYTELGRHEEARNNYQDALRFTELPAERNFLLRRLNRRPFDNE